MVHVREHVCMCTCVHACVFVCARMQESAIVRVCVCVCVCVYVYVYSAHCVNLLKNFSF